MVSFGCALSTMEPKTGLMCRVVSAAAAPFRAIDRGVDNMKMTALSAWAVHELGDIGASSVEVAWTYGDPSIEVSADFFDKQHFSGRADTGKRDRDVMEAVSQIIDDRVDALNSARQRRSTSGSEPWWHVLGVAPTATIPEVKQAFRSLARKAHPDVHELDALHLDMTKINVARDEAMQALA